MNKKPCNTAGRQKGVGMTPEAVEQMRTRREATRKKNRENAKAFGKATRVFQQTLTASDILHSPIGKTDKLIQDIIDGKRDLTL